MGINLRIIHFLKNKRVSGKQSYQSDQLQGFEKKEIVIIECSTCVLFLLMFM